MFTLKKQYPAFQVTKEGPFEYHTFKHGVVYPEVPVEEKHKFDSLKDPETVRDGKSKKGGEKA